MAQPFIAEKGVIRLSPLQKVVADRESAAEGNNAGANRSGGSTSSSTASAGLPEGVTQEQVAEATARAEAGDQSAIDWLKTIGIVGGAAATGYAIHRVLKGRKKGINGIGADNITTEAAAPNASSAVAKRTKPVDLYVDRAGAATETSRAGYIDAPYKVIGTGTPAPVTMDQMKALATPGQRYPVGPTAQQTQADIAYRQKQIQDAIRARDEAPKAAGRNAIKYGEIIRNIRKLP